VPYGTVPSFARIPGNKLPGYLHSVPSGQKSPWRMSPKPTTPRRTHSRTRTTTRTRTRTKFWAWSTA